MVLGAILSSGPGITFDSEPNDVAVVAKCIQRDEYGSQIWFGPEQGDVSRLDSELNAMLASYPEIATGIAFCSNYDGLMLFVSSHSESSARSRLDKEIERVSASYPDLDVYVTGVAASMSEIQDLATYLFDELGVQALTSIAPDIYSGGLSVELSPQEERALEERESQISQMVESWSRDRGRSADIPVTVRIAEAWVEPAATRAADLPPFRMGSRLNYGSGRACSAGVPLVYAGSRYLLTAGHCQSDSFTNNGYVVGRKYTTSYPGNAYRYGDWMLLGGATYSGYVYNGSLSSSSVLRISGAFWGSMSAGKDVCTSGTTTAQVCRYKVQASMVREVVGSVVTGHMVMMRHFGNLDGIPDTVGLRPGDSGGPCYYSDGNGGVIAAGIVTALSGDLGSSPVVYRNFYCTQLSGVRAWSGSPYYGG